jgi:xylulokinase
MFSTQSILYKTSKTMLLLGIDLGTSSIKVSVVDADTQQCVVAAQYPDTETSISSPRSGWAEQNPDDWWHNTQQAIKRVISSQSFNPSDVQAIGIAYQMHGLVMVDKNQEVLRPSIIWCDSRAVSYGQAAFEAIGAETCLSHLLNSPGNFTAAKLAWVKANEPAIFEQCDKIMLPGDFIAMKLSGNITTSSSALSEGILWDFQSNTLSDDVMDYFGFSSYMIPPIQPVFSVHGNLKKIIASDLGLNPHIPITYKAGDQPNNALSLGVLDVGEVAATAGTSGVIYAVTDQISYDPLSRVNTFAHVNHQRYNLNRLGILLCINGTGILNSWLKSQIGGGLSYSEMNQLATTVSIGSNRLLMYPFGNGAERVLQNKTFGGQMVGLNFNIHQKAHLLRAAQEGIAFAMNYGLNIMVENGTVPTVIKAGRANMFLSDLFCQTIVNVTNTPVELYDTDGAKGAALGAGIGQGYFSEPKEAFTQLKQLSVVEPNTYMEQTQVVYQGWKDYLINVL